MELYMHVPFCEQKCRYCDFASWAGRKHGCPPTSPPCCRECPCTESPGPTVNFDGVPGGGTPSVLPAEELRRRSLRGVMEQFPLEPGAEFTSEANPGTLTEAWLDTAVSLGVNRLSLGIHNLRRRRFCEPWGGYIPWSRCGAADLARQAG